MSNVRLPISKYSRQLAAIRLDLQRWHTQYRQAAAETDNAWLARRFETRMAELADTIAAIQTAEQRLAHLPRTSI